MLYQKRKHINRFLGGLAISMAVPLAGLATYIVDNELNKSKGSISFEYRQNVEREQTIRDLGGGLRGVDNLYRELLKHDDSGVFYTSPQ